MIRANHACFALLFLATVFTPSVEMQAANILLVTRDSSPNSDESARKSTFEGWGHTVNTIEDDDSQATYDAALAVNDLVWIPESIASASVGYKLREATITVVLEEQSSTDEMGFATYHGGAVQTNNVSITNNTHPITSSLSLGSLSFTSSNQELITLGGSYAAGATVLATASSQPTFLVIDTGGQLANTYNGSNLAFGPRVKLPVGGTSFDWSTLTTGGLQLIQSVVDWAVNDSNGLVAHWKFDEGSGTTVSDSSGSGNNASFNNGTPTWISGVRGGALEFDGSSDVATDANFTPPSTGTVAFWYRFTNKPTTAQRMLGLGDTWEILTPNTEMIRCDLGKNIISNFQTASEATDQGEWRHLAATYNHSADTYSLYIDGELVTAGSTTISSVSGAILSLATRTGSSQRFEGALDDVRVYNYELSVDEIDDLNTGMVAHWEFDETSGTTASDSTGSDNDGTLVGSPTWVSGTPRNRGLEFDSADRVDAGNFAVEGSTISLAAWIYVETPGHDARIIFRSSGNAGGDHSWGLTTDETGNLEFRIRASGVLERVIVDDVIEAQRWHHVVGAYDGTTVRLYLNGELIATQIHAGGGAIETDASHTVTMGDSIVGSRPFNGTLDDVRIYNHQLSQEEVTQLYGLIAHWKLDETSGTTAADSSGHGSEGTYVGSPTLGVNAPYATGVTITDESDYVTAESSNVLNTLGTNDADFTIALWVNPDSTGAGSYRPLFFKGSSGSDRKPGIWLDDNTNRITFHNGTTSNDYEGNNQFTSAISQNRWSHIVCQKLGSLCKIYIDGVLDYSYTLSGQTVGNTGPVHLGSEGSTAHTEEYTLDDVRVYNRALLESEIAELALGSLVNHWKLDESSGTTAIDSGTAKLDGTHTNGVTINQAGPYPGAVAAQFDGSDDKVDIPDADTDFSGGFSIALWVNPSASPGTGEGYAFFDMSNGAGVDQIWFGLFDSVGLQLYLTDTDDGSTLKTIEDNTSFDVGKWVHCVVTVDSDGFATLYRNGQITKSGFYTSLPTNITRTQNSIGTSTFDDPFPGSLDDVRLYRYALTQKEVAELYGLVGHWEFDEVSGTTIDDSTDAASDASFNTGTPVWIEGVRGYALEFDGTNDAQTSQMIEPPAEGAIAFWMRSDGQVASRQRQWGIGSDFETWQDTDGLVSMDIATDGYQGGFITTEQLDDKDYWYHIVAQYKSDDDTYEIYINGQLHKSGTSTSDIKQQAENYLTFGTRTGSSQRFIGALDDFRMYNRWLSLAEIAEIYGLVGWWRMEEVSGNVAYDSSGASNHGAFVGTPSWSNEAEEGFGSIELDGTNYVEVPGVIINSPSATISGWAKLTDASQSGAEVISLGSDMLIRLDDNNGEGIGSGLEAYYGGEWSRSKVDSFYVNTGWHHFSAVFDDRTLEVKLYIDGVLRSANAATGALVHGALGTSTMIGNHGSGATNLKFTGNLDDIRVYNRAITPGEARALYYGENTPGLRIIQWNEVANP